MRNEDIRRYAREMKVNLWEVSKKLGYTHESAFSRVFARRELLKEEKNEIRAVIDELAAER